MLHVRILVEALSIIIIALGFFYGWGFVKEYLFTNNYKPEMIKDYKTVDYLQSNVSFGTVSRDFDLWIILLCMLIFVVAYYGIRSYWLKRKTENA